MFMCEKKIFFPKYLFIVPKHNEKIKLMNFKASDVSLYRDISLLEDSILITESIIKKSQ